MPQVLLDCTSAAKETRGGVQNAIGNLVRALRSLETEFEFVVALRASHFRQRHLLRHLAPAGPRLLLPFVRRGAALLHALGVRLPRFRSGVPQMATIHDLGVFDVPHLYRDRWVIRRRARIRETLGRADAALVNAEYTKARLAYHIPEFTRPVYVAPHGVDLERFRPNPEAGDAAAVKQLGIDRPFLLQVGALSPRKKPEVTLEAFSMLRDREELQLVLPGKIAGETRTKLTHMVRQLAVEGSVVLPGFVPDELLPRLYRQARAFVFASEYEGFGLPVVEAMACGAPAAVSRASCLPEVAGDGALSFAPGNVEELAVALERLLTGGEEVQRLRERAVTRSRMFTWKHAAERTVGVYRDLLGLSV
jgi:glycosyltransferase involved in cell wall biosynthesis